MPTRQLFRAAIGRPEQQKLFRRIKRKLEGDPRVEPERRSLEGLLISAKTFARAQGLELEVDTIAEAIKNAQGDDLAIIRGEFQTNEPLAPGNYD